MGAVCVRYVPSAEYVSIFRTSRVSVTIGDIGSTGHICHIGYMGLIDHNGHIVDIGHVVAMVILGIMVTLVSFGLRKRFGYEGGRGNVAL